MMTSMQRSLQAVIKQQLRHDRPEPMQGWTDNDRAFQFADLVLRTKPETIVELGVFGGRSLIPMAIALRENKKGCIYGIDPWKKSPETASNTDPANRHWWDSIDLEKIHADLMKEIWCLKLDHCVIILRTESQYVDHLFPVSSIDIINIDASHSEVASCRDVDLYLPKVKSGGYIFMDDTNWASTQKAVAKIAAVSDLEKDFGGGQLYRKR